MPNGMMMKQQGNPLQRAAMANNQKYVPGTTASPLLLGPANPVAAAPKR